LGGGRAKIENSSRRHPRKFGQKRFLAVRRSWRGNGVACFWATSLEEIIGGVIAVISFRSTVTAKTRGANHHQYAARAKRFLNAHCRISARISASICGRPPRSATSNAKSGETRHDAGARGFQGQATS